MIQLLFSAKVKQSVTFDKTVMIGRQILHLKASQLKECLSLFGYSADDSESIMNGPNAFAEKLFSYLGASSIDSVDASSYEDATIIHDLNNPISSAYKSKFDLVLDSGTLEHVFNFPVAIKNCMEMTKTAGHFIGIYPCNNFFGHGFYQFSSELFYRTFSEENGFKILDVVIFVDDPEVKYYAVPDTSKEYERIHFTNTKPVYIYVLAKKIAEVNIFKTHPLQMDYSELKWKGERIKPLVKKKKKRLKQFIPPYAKNLIKAILNRSSVSDDTFFKKPFFKEYKLK